MGLKYIKNFIKRFFISKNKDRWWLERREHNGSEWWEYKSTKLSRLENNVASSSEDSDL